MNKNKYLTFLTALTTLAAKAALTALKTLTALTTLTVLALTASLSGCNGSATNDSNNTGRNYLLFAQFLAPIQDWDPHISSNVENQIFFSTYETLLIFEPDTNTFKNVLAKNYSKSSDGLVWTFELREGVSFHDGTPFNAEAVKFNVERIQRIGMSSSYIWAPVMEVKATGEYTVEFHLSEIAPLDLIVSSSITAWIVSPSVGIDDRAATAWFSEGNINGTGPYRLQSQIQGSEVVLTKNEDYWRGWEGKHIDNIVIRTVSETSSRRLMMESGEADMTMSLLSEDMVAMQDNLNLDILTTDGYKTLQCFINTQKPPLDDVRVRQALAYSYPAHMYVDNVKLGQFASMPTDTLLASALWGSLQEAPYSFDLDKAKQLLTEAGYEEGFTINVSNIAGTDDRKRILELWKAELQKININLEINMMQVEAILALAREPDKTQVQDLMIISMWPWIAHPHAVYGESLLSSAAWNFSYVYDQEMDAQIDDAYYTSCLDMDAGIVKYEALAKRVADEALFINMGDDKTSTVINKRVKGFNPNIAYELVPFYYDMWLEG